MKNHKKEILFLLIKIILIVIVLFIIKKYIFGLYIVKSINYKNININPNDFLIYYKLQKEYNNNDIVFYKNKIYRVVGSKGQIINKKNNKFYIDNDIYFDSILYNFEYPYTIKDNELFLISDNNDSRTYGCINKDNIDGKLIFRIQIRDF